MQLALPYILSKQINLNGITLTDERVYTAE